MRENMPIVREKKCPNLKCRSENVERLRKTIMSYQVQGYNWQVDFKCKICGKEFSVPEANLNS